MPRCHHTVTTTCASPGRSSEDSATTRFSLTSGEIFMVEVQSAPFTRPPLDQLVQGLKFALDKDYPARGDLTAKAA